MKAFHLNSVATVADTGSLQDARVLRQYVRSFLFNVTRCGYLTSTAN